MLPIVPTTVFAFNYYLVGGQHTPPYTESVYYVGTMRIADITEVTEFF